LQCYAARNWNAPQAGGYAFRVCPGTIPPADLAVRIKVAALSAAFAGLAHRRRRIKGSRRNSLDNVFRPLTVPATGGFFSAILVFRAGAPDDRRALPCAPSRTTWSQSDAPCRAGSLRTIASLGAGTDELELSLPHGLLLDVTVDAQGHMTDYQILSGPTQLGTPARQLDQIAALPRFSPC